MSRPFSFVRFAAFYLAALSCAQSRPALNPGSPDPERALAVGDALLDDELAQSPEFVALLRPPAARYDTLDDASLAAVAAREARENGWRKELAAIDRSALGESPAGLAYDIAAETLDARRQARACHVELWSVAPMFLVGNHQALQVQLGNLADSQPVSTRSCVRRRSPASDACPLASMSRSPTCARACASATRRPT